MATLTKQTLNDGARNLIVKIQIDADAGGDLIDDNLIAVSTYDGHGGDWDQVKVMRIESHLNGFSAQLLWGATSNVKMTDLIDGESRPRWLFNGGLVNNAGVGLTGDILLATAGLTVGDEGTMTLFMRKRTG